MYDSAVWLLFVKIDDSSSLERHNVAKGDGIVVTTIRTHQCDQQPTITEIMIEITSPGISYKLCRLALLKSFLSKRFVEPKVIVYSYILVHVLQT